MHIQDLNYPKAFQSMKVITRDVDGNPTRTEFYSHANFTALAFVWAQTWANSTLDTWQITEIA
jgi:hypothetical protein